jgi:AraC-like DNA-binding protein
MTKKQRAYEPHLAVREFSVPSGKTWTPAPNGWSVVFVGQGNGYCLHTQCNLELETGATLLLAGQAGITIRASQLGAMSLHTFCVMPGRLAGLITLGEADFLKQAAARNKGAIRLHPPQSPAAVKLKELCAGTGHPGGLLLRLKLLQLFIEAFGGELQMAATLPVVSDARERLQVFLRTTAPSELAEMSFSDLARRTNCTSRHLSRIFHELAGMSFREKRAEIRMARARELLAGGNSKVVEVALESGYKSLSLFNLTFTRRFGTSPGRWRQKYTSRSVSR